MKIQQKFDLSGKVAIITGASKGIGKAIALAFAQSGATVVVSSRKQEAVDVVAEEFKAAGHQALGVAAHMGDFEQIDHLVKTTIDRYGRIDIIVNNAAINPIFGPVQDATTEVFSKIMQVNVAGPFELAKKAYPFMKNQGGGSIINISSIESVSPGEGLGIYSISKSALITLTKVQAREWGRDKIRANAICPGLVKTKFSEVLISHKESLDKIMDKQALPMVAEPEDIAGLALFMASDASAFCTGGIYMADGGYTI